MQCDVAPKDGNFILLRLQLVLYTITVSMDTTRTLRSVLQVEKQNIIPNVLKG